MYGGDLCVVQQGLEVGAGEVRAACGEARQVDVGAQLEAARHQPQDLLTLSLRKQGNRI